MTTSSGDFERTPRLLLAAHIGEVIHRRRGLNRGTELVREDLLLVE